MLSFIFPKIGAGWLTMSRLVMVFQIRRARRICR
jgi:hypothetical protein